MATIAGVLRLDGDLEVDSDLRHLLSQLIHHAPYSMSVLDDGAISLGYGGAR